MTSAEADAWGRGDTRRLLLREFPAEVLALVDERQGGRFCAPCRRAGRTPPADEPLELDHLQPIAREGDNNWRNLAWACRGCNRGRCARPTITAPPRWARGPR